jgi:hypothetical protein
MSRVRAGGLHAQKCGVDRRLVRPGIRKKWDQAAGPMTGWDVVLAITFEVLAISLLVWQCVLLYRGVYFIPMSFFYFSMNVAVVLILARDLFRMNRSLWRGEPPPSQNGHAE